MDTQTGVLSLTKGEKINLTKDTALAIMCLGLGWDIHEGAGDEYDLDATMIALCGGKLTSADHVLFFNSPKDANNHPNILGGSMLHSGDNRTGAGDGDDETLTINFNNLPAEVDEIVCLVNIFDAKKNGYNFGQVKSASCRLYDQQSGTDIAKYDLNEDYSAFNGILVARLYKKDGEWKAQAMGEGRNGDIADICKTYGLV